MRQDSTPTPEHRNLDGIWGANAYAHSRRPWLLAGLTLLGIALIVAGSLGPWLTIERGPERAIEIEHLHGTNTDGVFSLFFASVAAVLLVIALIRPHLWLLAIGAFIALLLCTLVGLFDWIVFDPMDLAYAPAQQVNAIHVEWGLKLLTIAAPLTALSALFFARALMTGDY